jgi:hypothetical protein
LHKTRPSNPDATSRSIEYVESPPFLDSDQSLSYFSFSLSGLQKRIT